MRPAAVMILLVFVILIVPSLAAARTWYIKADGTGDAPTIGAGADSAAAGDTLLLADGLYTGEGNSQVLIYNSTLYIKSESNDPEACVIDCTGGGSFMAASGWEGHAWGGLFGVKVIGASPAVGAWCDAIACAADCIISGSSGTAMTADGFPSIGYGFAVAVRCTFSGNSYAMATGYKSMVGATDCVFDGNGCAIELRDEQGHASVTGCTILHNNGGPQGVLRMTCSSYCSTYDISRSIIAFNNGRPAGTECCECYSLDCCDVYGNTYGDYVGCFTGKYGVDGNFSAPPRFCDRLGGDYTIRSNSPCAPDSHPDGVPCGLIGALPVSCVPNALERTTWGSIKAIYR
jgi:hypothetical protein